LKLRGAWVGKKTSLVGLEAPEQPQNLLRRKLESRKGKGAPSDNERRVQNFLEEIGTYSTAIRGLARSKKRRDRGGKEKSLPRVGVLQSISKGRTRCSPKECLKALDKAP